MVVGRCSEGSQDHPRLDGLLQDFEESVNSHTLTALVYDSERRQISKGERHLGQKSGGKQAQAPQALS